MRIGACTTPHQQTKLKAVVLAKTTALLFVCVSFVIAVDCCFTFGTFFFVPTRLQPQPIGAPYGALLHYSKEIKLKTTVIAMPIRGNISVLETFSSGCLL